MGSSARIKSVKVIDKITRDPIANALVQLGTSENAVIEFHTDSEGIVTLKVISNCFYYLFRIIKDDYLTYTHTHGVNKSYLDYLTNTNSPIELEPKFVPDGTTNNSVLVHLNSTHVNGQIPIAHRKINIIGANGFKDSAYTGGFENYEQNLGKVLFTGLTSGIYTLSFEAEAGDYERREQEIQLAGNESKTIELTGHRKPILCSNNILIINFKDENGNMINC